MNIVEAIKEAGAGRAGDAIGEDLGAAESVAALDDMEEAHA